MTCVVMPLLRTGLLGVLLAGIVIVFQATDALKGETEKDLLVPVMVGVLAAAVYDQLVNLRDLYWQSIDESLDRVLNPRSGSEWPNHEQKRQFNLTHSDLTEGPARYRRQALEQIIAPPEAGAQTKPADAGEAPVQQPD